MSRRSPRRKNLPFPGPANLLRKPQYLCDYRDAAYELFKPQEDNEGFSVTSSDAAYRRAYVQALFSVVMTEATEHQGLSAFNSAFPTMKLPFRDIIATEVEESYIAAAAAVKNALKSQGRPVSDAEITRANVVNILHELQEASHCNRKSSYRGNFWNWLAKAFFIGENTKLEAEPSLRWLHAEYEERKTDFAVWFMDKEAATEDRDSVCIPLLLIEVSKYPLHSALAHEDESKLVTAMCASLLSSISECSHLKDESFVRKLHVYGLLIGADEFGVSVMYPDFGIAEAGTGPSTPFRTLSFVYRSSRKHWRFSLFGSRATDTNSEEAAAFNCSLAETEKHQIALATETIPHKIGNEELVFEVPSEHREYGLAAVQIEAENDIDGPEMSAFKEWFREIDAQKYTSFWGKPVNWMGVGVLERLGDMVKAESGRIAAGLKGNRPDRSNSYHYSEEFTRKESRSIRREPVSCLELKYWEDEMKTVWVDVRKRSSKYELAVYSQQQIQDSPYFPELRSSAVDDAGTLSLTLEASISQYLYADAYPERWDSEEWQRLTLSKMILDLMGALRALHATGFVHSNISPENVGFNMKRKVWQLYDFGQAMPIEESLQTQRSGGTHGYRSRHTVETGIFRVLDDYIALMNTCFRGFPISMFGRDKNIMRPFTNLRDMLSNCTTPEDTDFDKFYLEAFKVFCKETDQTSSAHQKDSTHATALLIQMAILEKLQ